MDPGRKCEEQQKERIYQSISSLFFLNEFEYVHAGHGQRGLSALRPGAAQHAADVQTGLAAEAS